MFIGGEVSAPIAETGFDLGDLSKLRRLATSIATGAGMSGRRASDLALALNEVATNAIVHGQPPFWFRVWIRDREVVCEVSDAGDGIEDATAGQLMPPATAMTGRGLWVARQLCDAVEIQNGIACTVSLHARIASSATVVAV